MAINRFNGPFQRKIRSSPVEEVQPIVTHPLEFQVITLWNSEFLHIFNHYPYGIPPISDGFLYTPMEFHCISNPTPSRYYPSGCTVFFFGKAQSLEGGNLNDFFRNSTDQISNFSDRLKVKKSLLPKTLSPLESSECQLSKTTRAFLLKSTGFRAINSQ